MLLESGNVDIVHHLLMYECDSKANFDDNNLPEGECDTITAQIQPCAANIASGWAVGGDYVSRAAPCRIETAKKHSSRLSSSSNIRKWLDILWETTL